MKYKTCITVDNITNGQTNENRHSLFCSLALLL